MLGTVARRWKQYKYRFVPWIALNLRKRKVRTVEGEINDKVILDSKVEQSLLLFFTGLSRQDNGSNDENHNPKVQGSRGQENTRVDGNRHLHSVKAPNWCSPRQYWWQYPNKKGCHKWEQISTQDCFNSVLCNLLEELNQRLCVQAAKLYWGLVLPFFLGFQYKDLLLDVQESPSGFQAKELSNYFCTANYSQQHTVTTTVVHTLTDTTSRSYVYAASQKLQGTRPRYEEGLEVMQRMLGFTIERRPSSIAGGGTGVFVTRGTVPAETVVAMYPGTVYNSWEPILLQSVANPFIFRCLDGTLIDGNNKAISRMVYRSCAQRDRVGPYLTSDLSWLTDAPTNPMAVGQYVNNRNKDNEANVAYQEFDVPDLFPIHLLQFIPNAFYSSAYQQGDTSNPRLMRAVVLVSLREIQCGEELFSSYFTIVH